MVTKKEAEGAAFKLIEHHLSQADEVAYRWYAGRREVDGEVTEVVVTVMSGADFRLFEALKKSGLQISFGDPAPAVPVDDAAATPEEPEPNGDA